VANKPTRRKFDPTKARTSRRVERPEISAMVETMTTSNPSVLRKGGRTIQDSTEIARKSGATAAQRHFAHVAATFA
jgi:hypothetical protein